MHVVIDFCDDTGFQSSVVISVYIYCIYRISFQTYVMATTRFVGQRLFILLVEFISVFIIVGVVSRS